MDANPFTSRMTAIESTSWRSNPHFKPNVGHWDKGPNLLFMQDKERYIGDTDILSHEIDVTDFILNREHWI